MKKGLLKKASALLSAVMLAGLVQVPAFAEVKVEDNFNEKTLSAKYDLVNANNFTNYTYVSEFKAGLGGKSDYALVNRVEGIPYDAATELNGGYLIPNYTGNVMGGAAANETTASKTTVEFSMLYGGDADGARVMIRYYNWWRQQHSSYIGVSTFVEIRDGVVYALGTDTGIKCNKDEWIRIAIVESYDATQAKVYINGIDTGVSLTGNMNGNLWTQANVVFKNGKTGVGTRSGYLAIDDVKVYNTEYVPTGDELVSYTFASNEDSYFDEKTKTVYVNEGTTIDTVLNGIDSDFEYDVLTSHNNGTVIADTAAAVANGNVVVFKSEDGMSYDYLTISTEEIDTTISYDPISAQSSFGTAASQFVGSPVTGLYGKSDDDYAYTFTIKDEYKNTTASISDRNDYMPVIRDQNLLARDEIITTEFSVASTGNANNLNAVARFNTTKLADGSASSIYMTPFTMNVKDGVMVNGKKVMDYKQNQWYRVAITWYPNLTMDIYINGVEAAKDWAYFGANNVGAYKITSVYGPQWFALQQSYAERTESDPVREGSFSFDDTLVYYGKYKENAKNAAGIVSDGYIVDENAGVIYMDNAVKASELEDVLTIIGDWNVYTDDTFTEETEDVAEGSVILVKSENGMVYKYYTVKTTISYDPISASSGFEQVGGKMQGSVTAGRYGKDADDYSYTFTVKDEFKAATQKIDDRNTYIPAVFAKELHLKNKKFTTEFSVAAEGNFDSFFPVAYFATRKIADGEAGDSAYASPFKMNEKDGVIVNDKKVMDFNPGQWYRVAVTWDLENFEMDVYINGVEAAKDWLFVDAEDVGALEIVGFHGAPTWGPQRFWFALQQIFNEGVEGDPDHNGSFSFDDTLVYFGEYKADAKNAAGIVSEDYIIDETAGEIYMEDGEVDVADLEDVLTITGDWSIYTDKTFEEEAEDVLDGAVILVKSENGMVYKYYTIKSPEVNYGQIATYVNGEDGNILEDGAVIKAEISAYAPSFLKKSGKLVLAIYENEALKTVVATEDKAIDGDTPFGVEYTVETAAGMSAKAMFIDSLNGLVPLTQDASFVELSE